MPQALTAQILRQGGPEVIQWVDQDIPEPSRNEVRMRNTVVGLNYIDTYHRSGVYPVELPSGLGVEAAGVIEAIGEGVDAFAPGDRVATFGPLRGAYSTKRNIPSSMLFKLPANIDDEVAAAALLKACTAEFLVERCARVEAGWPVVVHAAAGGVGLLLVQWLKSVGAQVIAVVSSQAKATSARQAGADDVVLGDEPLVARVRALTGGRGARVVFDGVGRATFESSLDCLTMRGLLVSFGNASGKVDQFDISALAAKGSLFVTRPTLFDYYSDAVERDAGAARVFAMLGSGQLGVTIGQRYALEEAARAHAELEGRQTTGSSILMV